MPQALILAIKVSCYTAVGRSRGPTEYLAFLVRPITQYPADIREIVLEILPTPFLAPSCSQILVVRNFFFYLMSKSRIRLDIILVYLPCHSYI
jgi:hypothetical protein